MEIIPINPKAKDVQKTEMEQLEQKEKEYKYVGSQLKVPGHTLFYFNLKTKEVGRASIIRKAIINFDGTVTFEERVDNLPDCYYEQALNEKNFRKRLKRRGLL